MSEWGWVLMGDSEDAEAAGWEGGFEPLIIHVKGGLRASRRPSDHCLGITGNIRPTAEVESGFKGNLVSVHQSEGMDGGVWLGEVGTPSGPFSVPGSPLWPEPCSLPVCTIQSRECA